MRWLTQKQKAGDKGANLQAGRDIIVKGMSYTDIKEITKDVAMEVFRENTAKLAHDAHRIAYARAEEFAENFLEEIIKACPDALHNMQEPGMQQNFLEAQSSYASTGDGELGDLLVNLLIDRTMREDRDLAQLALNSAITVAKELRSAHFSLLAHNLFVKGMVIPADNIEELARDLEVALYPLQDALYTISPHDLDYLAGRGCIISATGQLSIAGYLRMNLPGMFTRGFNVKEWPGGLSLLHTPLVRLDPENPDYHRLDINTYMDLETLLSSYDREDLRETAMEALRQNTMQDYEIETLLCSASPRLANTFSRWRDLNLGHYVNTATGTAIGHSYLKGIAGKELPPLESFV